LGHLAARPVILRGHQRDRPDDREADRGGRIRSRAAGEHLRHLGCARRRGDDRLPEQRRAAGTSQALTVSGSTEFVIPKGDGVTTDPLPFAVRAWEDLAISLYLPDTAVPASRHNNARTTSFLTAPNAGDHTADGAAAAFTATTVEMLWVAAVDVFTDAKGAVIFFGDSITDGTATTTDGHDRWHDVAFLRTMLGMQDPDKAFVNEGIGGNRVTVTNPPGSSPAAVQRLDRDVLARSGATDVVFFEGTNDLASGLVDADQLIAGMQEVIARVKAARLRIIGVTIIPRSNATWTPLMTAYRNKVNAWIRNEAGFQKVLDFDAVTRDPTNPDIMDPLLDFGDHIHPNLFGYLKMGQAVDLSALESGGGK
jgi:lysophospholipase L1-like esterase